MTTIGTKIVVRFPWWSGPLLVSFKAVARVATTLGWKPSDKIVDRIGTFIGELIVRHSRFTCE